MYDDLSIASPYMDLLAGTEIKKSCFLSHIDPILLSEKKPAPIIVREAVMKGIRVKEFYGDGAIVTNVLFTQMHSIGARPVIKIRKNASPGRYVGSRYRRRTIREYQEKGRG